VIFVLCELKLATSYFRKLLQDVDTSTQADDIAADFLLLHLLNGFENVAWVTVGQTGEQTEHFFTSILWHTLKVVDRKFQRVLQRRVTLELRKLLHLFTVVGEGVQKVAEQFGAFLISDNNRNFGKRILIDEISNEARKQSAKDYSSRWTHVLFMRCRGKVYY
jgi:hypothetical protein